MPPKIEKIDFLFFCLMHSNGKVDAAAVAKEFNNELSASAVQQRLGRIVQAFREKKPDAGMGNSDHVKSPKKNAKAKTGKVANKNKRKAEDDLADEELDDAMAKRIKKEEIVESDSITESGI